MRPRSHQLEEESRRSFRQRLPSAWVFRDAVQDYGIDAEVEIFDSDGAATGATFLVQLKATDTAQRKVTLSPSKVNYYQSLQRPVLLVLFVAGTGDLFVRWVHSLRQTRRGSITCRFVSADLIDENAIASLEIATRDFYDVRSTSRRRPLLLALAVADPTTDYQLRSHLAQDFKGISDELRLVDNSMTSHRARTQGSRTEIALAGFQTVSYEETPGATYAQQTADLVVAVGLSLYRLGHIASASRLVLSSYQRSTLSSRPTPALHIAQCLSAAGRTDEAIRCIEVLHQASPRSAANAFLAFLVTRQHLSEAEFDLANETLLRLARDSETKGDKVNAGILRYNLGKALSGRGLSRKGLLRRAVGQYRAALHLNPGYAGREYFWRELAGILFEARRYKAAASLYERAYALKPAPETAMLRADALMFSGRYKDAEDLFSEHSNLSERPHEAEWELKRLSLGVIRQVTGLDEQKRASLHPAGGELRTEELCVEILKEEDGLSNLAWYNLGIFLRDAENPASAATCFAIAALVAPADVEAWGNAIALAFNTKDAELLALATIAGFGFHGERLLRHVAERAGARGPVVYASLREITAFAPRPAPPLELRPGPGPWDMDPSP